MNKTVKTILQIAGYIISALLGAYGGSEVHFRPYCAL